LFGDVLRSKGTYISNSLRHPQNRFDFFLFPFIKRNNKLGQQKNTKSQLIGIEKPQTS